MMAAAFDDLSFHDNTLHGLHLRCPEPDRGLWRSELVLDIDHIVEWVCATDGGVRFRVSAATLVFRDVGGVAIDISYDDGLGDALSEMSIAQIRREPDAARPAACRATGSSLT